MKVIMLGVILGLGSIAPSLAADLPEQPYSAPASYVPFGYNWTGFYVGANAGYGWTEDCLRVSGPFGQFFEEGCHNATGGVAGGQVGYRWQFDTPMVWGLEVQGDWASLRGSHVSFIDPTSSNDGKSEGWVRGSVAPTGFDSLSPNGANRRSDILVTRHRSTTLAIEEDVAERVNQTAP